MQSLFQVDQRPWFKDLCDYYSVSAEDALLLGTRGSGRKPSLPGSQTTHPVAGKTFEDIWAESPRRSQEEIFKFYSDQGAWSAFRQVVRHKEMRQFHLSLLQSVLQQGGTYCEYGCGVAPFTHSLLETVAPNTSLKIFLSDVECEHFTFGLWRARRVIQERALTGITLEAVPVLPNQLPRYSAPLDAVLIFEVLEHVPSPIQTASNLASQLKSGGLFCENFIKHDRHNDDDGPDLRSAAQEREQYYTLLKDYFQHVAGRGETEAPNDTRIWQKK
jgi:hypothetical protein